jgi:hypothetical protein
MRMDRPGVRLDPPARQSGQDLNLRAAQLRTSVFLHVRGGRRTSYALTQLTDVALARIHDNEWRLLDVGPAAPDAAKAGHSAVLFLPPDETLPPTEIRRRVDLGLPEAPPLAPPSPPKPPKAPAVPTGRNTALVRLLRREVARLRLENDALRSRLSRLRPKADADDH